MVVSFLIAFSKISIKPSKEQQVDRDIRDLNQYVYLYRELHGNYPESLEYIGSNISGKDISEILYDPWGFRYVYKLTEEGYELYSEGVKANVEMLPK